MRITVGVRYTVVDGSRAQSTVTVCTVWDLMQARRTKMRLACYMADNVTLDRVVYFEQDREDPSAAVRLRLK